VWTVASGVLYPLARGIWHVVHGPALHQHRLRAVLVTGATVGFAALALFAVKLPYGTVTQGVVWAPAGADVRAGAEGQLTTLIAAPGASLTQGEPVARLTDTVLDARVRLLQSQLREVELRYLAAEVSDRVQAQMLRRQMAYFQSELDEMRARRQALEVTAPLAGRFLVAMPADMDGKYLKRGELIGYVLDDRAATVRVIVPQSEIELVRDDTRGVDLRLASDPMDVLHVDQVSREVPTATRQLPSVALATVGGGPIAVDPSDEQHLRALEVVFQMDVKLPEDARDHRIGERVYVRFQHGGRTLAWRISRSVRQLFLRRFDL
jgi:putative peptide zinc metalloprotease protein